MTNPIVISSDDQTYIQNHTENNPICRFLKTRDERKFQIGDILVRHTKGYGENPWKVETISSSSTVPKRFMYVFENELGVGYLKQLRSREEGFCQGMFSLADIDLSYQKYEIDQSYADSIIFQNPDAFDHVKEANEVRKIRAEITKKNKKLCFKPSDVADMQAYLLELNPNDQLWFSWSMSEAADKKPFLVTKVEVKKLGSSYGDQSYPTGMTHKVIVEGVYDDGITGEISDKEGVNKVFFKQQPYTYKDKNVG